MLTRALWLCYLLAWVQAMYIPDDGGSGSESTGDTMPTSSINEKDSQPTLEARLLGECNTPLLAEGDDPCKGREKEPGWVDCTQPCTFTLEWFMDNRRFIPGVNECLFYTARMSENAQNYAKHWNDNTSGPRLTTIWDLWPKPNYEGKQTIDNPMRCIIQPNVWAGRDNQVRTDYFRAMSNAMAYMCGGTAIVMESNLAKGGSGQVKMDSIWGQVEFPRLQMDGEGALLDPDTGDRRVCNRIDAIGPDLHDNPDARWQPKWWRRNGSNMRRSVEGADKKRSVEVEKRDNQMIDSAKFDDPSGDWFVNF